MKISIHLQRNMKHLNRKFKTNPKSKYEWIFEHFPKNENLNILELGCGPSLAHEIYPIESLKE